jgi:hypothetical protein
MKKAVKDQAYVKWMFMLGEYYGGKGDCNDIHGSLVDVR